MAIKIKKEASGSFAKVTGITVEPIPVNSFVCGETLAQGKITVFNPDQAVNGDPRRVIYNIPFEQFVKSDGSVPTDVNDLAADINAQLEAVAPTDVSAGYRGLFDAVSTPTSLADDIDDYNNGDWFFVSEGADVDLGDGTLTTLEKNDQVKLAITYDVDGVTELSRQWDLIKDTNAKVSAIESSPINSFDLVVDEDYRGALSTGSALQPFKDLATAVSSSSEGDNILVKGSATISAEVVLPHSLNFYGTSDAEIKYATYDATNGDIFSFEGDGTQEFTFEHITFRNAGGYGLLIKKTEEVNIRNCEFYNNGWDGTQLHTVLSKDSGLGLLGYDSTNTELQAFYAGSHASNGGAVRLQECRKPLIRESRAEGNLRGFRVQDCGINGGGFLIENQAIGNIESGIYIAAGSLGGSQNITVAINYSAYNANNGLLCIGGINNKFSQNEVYGNWNAGFCAWGSVNVTLRDCGLYDNNRSTYNGIGNTGDAKASIQINDAYSFIPYQLAYNPAMRFIVEILDTQVHYTGLGSNTDKVGFLLTSGMGNIPDSSKNIIKVDDVGFIGQDYAIDLSEVDVSNLRLSLGDNSYQSIGEKAVKAPLAGNYSELPFSNHVMEVPEVDVVVDTLKQTIALHEGVGGNVINVYAMNELQSVLKANSVDIMQRSSDKIQLRDCTLGNVYINGVVAGTNVSTMNDSLNAAFSMDLVQYKSFLESEVGVSGGVGDVATFYYIESPDNNFEYPLFKTEAEAKLFSDENGGGETAILITYADDLSNTTWYRPNALWVDNGTSAPVNGVYGTSTNVIWNIQPTDDDANYVPTFNDITYSIQEGSAVNIVYKPAGDTDTYNVTNVPTGYADTGYAIVGSAETITDGIDIVHTLNVTKANVFGSDAGTITLTVTNDPSNDASSSITPFTKAIDFSASAYRFLKQKKKSSRNPALKMNHDNQTYAPHSTDASKVTDASNAMGWLAATVFQPQGTQSGNVGSFGSQIWSVLDAETQYGYGISLVQEGTDIFFSWGVQSTYPIGARLKYRIIENADPNKWYAVYIAHKGAKKYQPSASEAAAMFDIRVMSSDDSFASVTSNLSNSTDWGQSYNRHNASMTTRVQGDLDFGGRNALAQFAFGGKIASCVMHGLMRDTSLPDDAEIKKIITDPLGWETDYLIGNLQWRYQNSTHTYVTNTYSAGLSTQIWLMGDGASDSFPNFYNEVLQVDTGYARLDQNNMQATDVVNVSISGLS